MTKIVVGSPSLTQPLLLYPGLRPAMLNNIGGVGEIYRYEKKVVLDVSHKLSVPSFFRERC
jgi:hypothetical protein